MASCWKTPALLLIVTLLGALAGAVEERDANAVYDPALYQAMEFRSIGPTDSARTRFTYLSKELDARLGQLREVVDSDMPAFNDLVKRKGATAIFVSGF